VQDASSVQFSRVPALDLNQARQPLIAVFGQVFARSSVRKLAVYEKQMLASPGQQISLTDPDSRSMAKSQLVDSVAVAVTNVGYGTLEFRANLVYSVLQFIGFVLIRNFHQSGHLCRERAKLVAQGLQVMFRCFHCGSPPRHTRICVKTVALSW
jgi:hypothetical protein